MPKCHFPLPARKEKILLLKRMETQFVAVASIIQFCRVYLTLTPDRWGLSLDSF